MTLTLYFRIWFCLFRQVFQRWVTSLQYDHNHESYLDDLDELVGLCGVWASRRRYSGRVLLNGKLYPAYSPEEIMYPGNVVLITKRNSFRLVVETMTIDPDINP